MTQQMESQPIAIAPSLERKLREFADGLTAEEEVQLYSMRVEAGADALSPSLRAKAQRAADALTTADVAQLRRLLEQAGVAVTTTGEAEVHGYRVAQYEDAYGYKGKIGTGGESLPPVGNSSPLLGPLLAFGFIVGTVFPGVVLVEYPEYRDPNY